MVVKSGAKVANDLEVSTKDVAEMETRLSGQDVTFDITNDDTSDQDTFAPAAYLEDKNSNFAHTFENNDYHSFEVSKLSGALNELDERTKMVIKRRWLDENKATLQELADDLHVSVERVRQIEVAGMKKLRANLIKAGVNEDIQTLENKSATNKSS